MRLHSLAATAAGVLSFCSAHAFGAPEIVAHSRLEGGPRLVADGGRHRIEIDQRVRPIELPPRATVDALESLGAGWLVAGSSPDEAGNDLFLMRGDERQEERLPAPSGRVGKVRRTAVPLVDGDQLVGVAWLEGAEPRSFDVRFAAWRGDRFAAPEIVAPAGPGSQLALSGSRLADGRLLLVWAGFDGQDDEIWFSVGSTSGSTGGDASGGRGALGRWSKPSRAADDNAVPDITPVVASWAGGALLSWSRFDGSEYRLMTARFEGERMHDARFAAPPGSLFPSLEAGPSGLAILYRDAHRSAWTLAEVGRDGKLGKSARIDSEGDERPMVSFEGSTVLWSFGERRAVSSWQ